MIIDALANMEFYKGLNEQLYKGLTFLKDKDLASLPVGRYDIDGDEVFALVQDTRRAPRRNAAGKRTTRIRTSSTS